MLNSLSIRDVVLIERLDLNFASGLTTLTGETGAGKSILLDSLGLALGARADTGLIRSGAEQAVVAAAFSVPPGHPALTLLTGHGLDSGSEILLRRIVTRDGRSRALVNDQPVSVTFLKISARSSSRFRASMNRLALRTRRTISRCSTVSACRLKRGRAYPPPIKPGGMLPHA